MGKFDDKKGNKENNFSNKNKTNKSADNKIKVLVYIAAAILLAVMLLVNKSSDIGDFLYDNSQNYAEELDDENDNYESENIDTIDNTEESDGLSTSDNISDSETITYSTDFSYYETNETSFDNGCSYEDYIADTPDVFSTSYVDMDIEIPRHGDYDYLVLNNNVPLFTSFDIDEIDGEHFSNLDSLSRCGTAYALLDESMMPTAKRDSISDIKPSGWWQKYYDGYVDSDPPALYNRSHLIAYALTGQNSNEKNLITGTRYFNAEIMLVYEEAVMRYLEESGNHVLYRVSPYFEGDELVARGVEMEAFSVEDNGEGICYHVFVYNYQPEIYIDYTNGYSAVEEIEDDAA